LRNSVSGGEFQAGELKCAIESYERALDYLKYLDNPELRSALFNNRALAALMQRYLEGVPGGVKLARSNFEAALKLSSRKNRFGVPYHSGLIAGRNLVRLRKFVRRNQMKKLNG